jgi:hypothetical protein
MVKRNSQSAMAVGNPKARQFGVSDTGDVVAAGRLSLKSSRKGSVAVM